MRLLCLLSLGFLSFGLLACGDDSMAFDGTLDGGVDSGVFADAGDVAEGGVDSGVFADAGDVADAGVDAFMDASSPDAGPDRPSPPEDIFFVGNSFTFGGPVPTLVRQLAISAGFAEPNVEFRAVGGRSLRWHRDDEDADNAPNRVGEGWDVVVLQDFSTRPTDAAVGEPEGFKADATWFHDLARTAQPDCRVVLYETWARRFNHPIYPSTYEDPADMQAQLRFHYNDAADRYIPAMSTVESNVVVAPVGDAWELQLSTGEPPKLHADDDYHAGAAGQYLNALVIYSTIYETLTQGLEPIGVSPEVAAALQASADATTGFTRPPPSLGD